MFVALFALLFGASVCEGPLVTDLHDYVDPRTGEVCVSVEERTYEIERGPAARPGLRVDGVYHAGYSASAFQGGGEASVFVGTWQRSLEMEVDETVRLECDELGAGAGMHLVHVVTRFQGEANTYQTRDCATGREAFTFLPPEELPFLEVVRYWDVPCGERPVVEVLAHRTFPRWSEFQAAYEEYLEDSCTE